MPKSVSSEGTESTKKEDNLLTFLKQTKDGKYAKIDEKLLTYTRISISVQEHGEDEYYYSIS
jgi:hypothetical protein